MVPRAAFSSSRYRIKQLRSGTPCVRVVEVKAPDVIQERLLSIESAHLFLQQFSSNLKGFTKHTILRGSTGLTEIEYVSQRKALSNVLDLLSEKKDEGDLLTATIQLACVDPTLTIASWTVEDPEEILSKLEQIGMLSVELLQKETGCSDLHAGLAFLRKRTEAQAVADKTQIKKDAHRKEEALLEASVLEFFKQLGVAVESQLIAGQHRLDIVVPGELIIELKAGKITANDMCQALDYLASYPYDVLLVGTGLTSEATRGMEAINRIAQTNKILFVSRNASFKYLNAIFK